MCGVGHVPFGTVHLFLGAKKALVSNALITGLWKNDRKYGVQKYVCKFLLNTT
jgi:hypothetical protein